MIEYVVDASSIHRFQARLNEAPRIVLEEGRKFVDRALVIAHEEVYQRFPVDEGRTRQGLVRRLEHVGSLEVIGSLQALPVPGRPPELAKWLEEGTRPHVIRPREAKALRFVQGGQLRFAKKVQHPGTRPYRFFRDGLRAARPRIVRSGSAYLGWITRRLGGR